jgi:hypothetical protein
MLNQAMPSKSLDRRITLRHSHAWLWWKHINYGGRDLYGILFLMLGLVPLMVTAAVLVAVVTSEVPYWLHGQVTEATITGKSDHVVRGAKGGTRTVYDLSYGFSDAAGNSQQGWGSVSAKSWQASSIGGKVAIVYLPGDPRQNRPQGQFGASAGVGVVLAMFLGFGVLPTLFGATMLIVGLQTLASRVRLIETGEATAGIVERLEPTGRSSQWPVAYECSYRYLVPAQRGAQAQVMRGTVVLYPRQATMRVGDLVLVVFDPDLPHQHAVDIHQARWEEPAALWKAAGAWPAEK